MTSTIAVFVAIALIVATIVVLLINNLFYSEQEADTMDYYLIKKCEGGKTTIHDEAFITSPAAYAYCTDHREAWTTWAVIPVSGAEKIPGDRIVVDTTVYPLNMTAFAPVPPTTPVPEAATMQPSVAQELVELFAEMEAAVRPSQLSPELLAKMESTRSLQHQLSHLLKTKALYENVLAPADEVKEPWTPETDVFGMWHALHDKHRAISYWFTRSLSVGTALKSWISEHYPPIAAWLEQNDIQRFTIQPLNSDQIVIILGPELAEGHIAIVATGPLERLMGCQMINERKNIVVLHGGIHMLRVIGSVLDAPQKY